MANTTFQLRRSSVAGKVPNTSTLSIGELGLNLTDQILYSSNGTGVFELGANVTNQTVKTSLLVGNSTVNTTINSSSITVLSIIANGSVGTDSQVLTSNGTGIYWSNSSVSGASRTYSVTTVSGTQNTFTTPGQFVTGTTDVYLNGVHLSNSDYLEVNSTAIQLTSDATDGSIVEVSGWVTINTLVAGANTTIQFNDSGYINSSSTFTWNKDTELLTVGNSSVNTQIVAGNVFLNGSTLVVGNTSTNVTINSTSVSIGANNLTVGTSLYAVSNGNVGIGTSSPSYKLHSTGTIRVEETTGAGVYANSISNYGVLGTSNSNIGVYGISNTSQGVYATSVSNYAVYGSSTNSHGVVGVTGVSGGIGLYGLNNATSVYFYGAYSSYSMYGNGNGYVAGSFSKGSGSFNIPHPLPELSETHRLIHSFVESPTADNIYRGKIQLQNGQATVNIDTHVGLTEGTFSALNGNIQVFLQNESGWDLVRGSVTDNILTIISQNQSSTDTISWMVIGERQDQHMLDTQWTDEFGRPILEPLKESEPDVALPPEPGVPNENG